MFVRQLHGQAMPNRHFQAVQCPPKWKLCLKAVVVRLKARQVDGIGCHLTVVVGMSIVGWAVERSDEEGIVLKNKFYGILKSSSPVQSLVRHWAARTVVVIRVEHFAGCNWMGFSLLLDDQHRLLPL